jgi:broad specificity phosphatase PhoE
VQAVFDEHRDKPVDAIWEGLEGGESFRAFEARVTAELQRLLDDADKPRVLERPALFAPAPDDRPESTVVVVAHGGTNGALLCHLLGFDAVPWEWERLVSFHASVSEVRPVDVSHRHAYSLFRFSDVAHLPPACRPAESLRQL